MSPRTVVKTQAVKRDILDARRAIADYPRESFIRRDRHQPRMPLYRSGRVRSSNWQPQPMTSDSLSLTPVAAVGRRRVGTVEGLGSAANMNPLQRAFLEEQAAQCGYCIAGMIMRAQALIETSRTPDEAQIRRHMQPNLCRAVPICAFFGRYARRPVSPLTDTPHEQAEPTWRIHAQTASSGGWTPRRLHPRARRLCGARGSRRGRPNAEGGTPRGNLGQSLDARQWSCSRERGRQRSPALNACCSEAVGSTPQLAFDKRNWAHRGSRRTPYGLRPASGGAITAY